MAGKVKRSIRLASGPIVEITVPINATKQQLRDAIAEQASKVSPDLTRDLSDIGVEPTHYFEKAAAPKSALAGFEPGRKSAREILAPLSASDRRDTISAPPRNPTRLPTTEAFKAGIGDWVEGTGNLLSLPSRAVGALTGIDAFDANWGTDAREALDLPRGNPYAETVNQFAAEALLTGGAGRAALPFLGPTGRAVAGGLGADEPIREGIAGAGAGLATEAAEQAGLPWWAQVGAGLAGGVGAYGATSAPVRNALADVAADNRGVLMPDKFFRGDPELMNQLKTAKAMKKQGASDAEIWSTGWHWLPFDKKWVREVSDKGFDVDVDALAKIEPGKGTDWRDTVSHPGMEALLGDFSAPGMNRPLIFGPFFEKTDPLGSYSRKVHGARVNLTGDDILGTTMHEIGGHALARVGGMLPGGTLNPKNMVFEGPSYDRNYANIEPKLMSFINQGGNLINPAPGPEKEWVDQLNNALSTAAQYEGYLRLPGENLAEANRKRLSLDEATRPTWNPGLSMPYDYSRQLNPEGGFGPSGKADPMQDPINTPTLTTPLSEEMSIAPPESALPAFEEPDQLPPNTIIVGNRLRSTINSKGQPLGRDEDEIRNFWNWYGDSVTTDENGLPKPWYHGSMRGNIEAFERVGKAGYPSENTINAIGSWFTDDPKTSNIYAGASRPDEGFARYGENAPHGGTSYPVYLRMQNPRPLRAEGTGHGLADLWREYAGGTRATGTGPGDVDAFREYLSSHGYDSMWGLGDDIEGGPGLAMPGSRYAIIPDQTSIKSVFNSGSFNPDDPRISHSIEPPDPDLPPIPEGLQGGRSDAVSRAFEGVTDYDGARAVAEAGGHLKPDKSGKLIGSPDLTEADLGPWRARLDKLIADANQMGLGWYEDVRKAIGEISETPEQASLMARGGAGYSPQASPTEETNYFFRHHNERVLSGEEPVVTTGQRAAAVNKGYGDVGNSGYIELTPENINLGKKTGPYGVSKDPTVPMGWEAASDLWHGRALEYAPNEGQAAFDRAFSDTEHAFIKGENVLALERAKAAGTLPPDATVANLQEVVWVKKRYDSFMDKENARYAAGKRKKEGPPTHEQAMHYALEGVRRGIDRATAVVSREFTPGGGLGEFPGMAADKALNERFAAEMAAPGGEKSSAISALQMYQKPGVRGEGYWMDPVEGLQQNPVFMDRPQVGLKPEMVGDKPGGVAMAPSERNALLTVGRLFGLENVQHGVGANIFVPRNSSHKATQLNGMYFGPAQRDEAMRRAHEAGLDVVDNGDGGIVVTKFTDTAEAAKLVKGFAPDLDGKPGRFDSNYAPSGLSAWDDAAGGDVARPQGEGIATKELLEATGSIPGFEQRLAASNYPQEVAQRNAIRQRYATELATSLRPDVQRLRDLLAKGGPQAVRDWVRVHGWKGLPAWAGIMLGGGAMLSSEEQAQPAI
jgi:hypothetical protein